MSMKRNLAIAVVALAAAGGYYYWQASAGVAAFYTNTNIQMGSVADAQAADCMQVTGQAKLACLAKALTASATPEQKAKLQLPYSVESAKKWSNFPPFGYPDRIGITLGELTATQLPLVKAILKEAAGLAANEGYDEIEQILNADDYLKANTADTAGFSSSNYHFAFLGEPADTGTWQLYFGGHHLAFANTYKDGKLVGATPSFRGVEPFTPFDQNGRNNAPLVQEQAAFAAMLSALSPEQQAKAKLSAGLTNIVAGPQQDDAMPTTKEGLRVGDLAPDQQALVMAAIAPYVTDISGADATQILKNYQQQLAETFIAYSGTPTVAAENDYVRIDGPSLWIELSMQPGRSIPGVHPHSVWRDRTADYGGNK
jgi:hypothetical protein